jgi:DNA-dependent RNA polymerase auxiliary subunit epsilon
MKTTTIILMAIGFISLTSCVQKTDTDALLGNTATRTELFKAIANNDNYMIEFMDNIEGNNQAMQMMTGNQKIMGSMMKDPRMQMMMMNDSMMSMNRMKSMMKNGMGMKHMKHMMQMMHSEGMMSKDCMNSSMKMMNDKTKKE